MKKWNRNRNRNRISRPPSVTSVRDAGSTNDPGFNNNKRDVCCDTDRDDDGVRVIDVLARGETTTCT